MNFSVQKNHNSLQKDIVSFIKNADLDLEDFKYEENNLPALLPAAGPCRHVGTRQTSVTPGVRERTTGILHPTGGTDRKGNRTVFPALLRAATEETPAQPRGHGTDAQGQGTGTHRNRICPHH